MKQELENQLSESELLDNVPQIIFEENPELSKFSFLAWKLAYQHIKSCSNAPQSPFMDEAFAQDRIWIWDTCFMSLYCKYAPHIFPGIESLRNFYLPMLDGIDSPLKVHIPDNPPLFSWAEYENYLITGNIEHLEKVFCDYKYPQRMFELFDSFKSGQTFPYMSSIYPVQWEKKSHGYQWTGGRNGMDNTPRGDFKSDVVDNDPKYHEILYIDAAAQQALSAKIIYELTSDVYFKDQYDILSDLINKYYWDKEDGCYYDIKANSPYDHVKVMTPASYWPLLAEVASAEQANAMAQHAANQHEFGGNMPFPSVARNSPHFDPEGGYWRGGVWLPTAYMSIKSLEKYGFYDLADTLGKRIVMHQYNTWKQYKPHTIWEAYSPTEAKPSTRKHTEEKSYCKPDFCGWSALGPINLMIENVIGIRADASTNMVKWRIHHDCSHGIKNYRFNNATVDLLFDGNNTVTVTTDKKIICCINNTEQICNPGKNRIYIE